MGIVTGQEIADNVAGLMNDTDRVRWTDADYLVWLNEGHREAVMIKNDSYITNASVLLTPSATRQDLPADGMMLIDVTRNMGADGNTPGKALRVGSKESLDAQLPNWHNDPADAVNGIGNYMYDPRDPYRYYVYPQAPATDWYVELVYAAVPPALTSLSETIYLRDVYANALIDYLIYRANSRDEVDGQPHPAAMLHYQKFSGAFGLKGREEVQNNPNQTTRPPAPVPAASASKPG